MGAGSEGGGVSRPAGWWWTDSQIAELDCRYPDERTEDIANDIGRSLRSTYQMAIKRGLKKSPGYLASDESGRRQKGQRFAPGSEFKPGQSPWNKGRSFNPGGRSAETQFKRGRAAHEAHNYLPIGTERVSRDGYLERKVTDDPEIFPAKRWVAVHRIVWEEANGPIPAGHIVVFRPGCATTEAASITAERLECISRVENMRRNSYHNNYPKEVGQLIQLRGALNRRIGNRIKRIESERTNEEQGQ